MTCVYCQIATEQLPSHVVHADAEFLAFHDVQPRAKTHVLIVPRTHVSDLDAWVRDGGSSDRMLAFVRATAQALDIAGAYRLITDIGEDAGQVVEHLHWHIVAGKRLPGFG